MDRINRLQMQLQGGRSLQSARNTRTQPLDVFLSPRDAACPPQECDAVLTAPAVAFVAELVATFQQEIDELHGKRSARQMATQWDGAMPHFLEETRGIREDATWSVDVQPAALLDRRVDIGDVSPADREFLLRALNSGAQGVQVDFDDGHCPTWNSTLRGHFNIMEAARGRLELPARGLKLVSDPALLVIRPRAWNMDEPNMLVNGRVVPGAVFDFAMHLFHNGKLLLKNNTGPFLYLSKLEGYKEAALWRKIFEYTEEKFTFPKGSIKATVLIENIFAAFEMDEILFELRHHSAGLNCGMWDYTASIVVNFRCRPDCLLPDRQQYVSMKSDFLKHYMELLIRTCKRRSAPATTGMVPFVLAELPTGQSQSEAIEKARVGKRMEAVAGSDGALVYDVTLVKPVQEVFTAVRAAGAYIMTAGLDEAFYTDKLFTLPRGSVTLHSVETNARVALLYVLHWLYGHGTVVVNGCVEDSATAEISRAQLWQWVHHQVSVDGTPSCPQLVNAALIQEMLTKVAEEEHQKHQHSVLYLDAARNLVLQLSTMRTPPVFITTFLLEQEPLTKLLQSVRRP